MQSQSFISNNLVSLKKELLSRINQQFKPTLAFVFASVEHDLAQIVELFNQHNIVLAGCSTAGEIVDGNLYEYQIGTLLMDMPLNCFKTFSFNHKTADLTELGVKLADFARNSFENSSIVVLSSGLYHPEQLVDSVKQQLGNEVSMFGGLAGDDLKIEDTFVFDNKSVDTDAIVGIIVDRDKIEVTGMAFSGWEAIGTVHTITKAKGNVVYQINNEPALDVFIKYFGHYGNLSNNTDVATAQYPLQIMRENGYSVLRSPLSSNPKDGSISLAGGVMQGDKFKFSVSPGFEVIDATVGEFIYMKNSQAINADALIMFSCKGRHASLGPLIEDELAGIYNAWHKPMLGFLSYGEIGCVKNGSCDFHNETCTLLILKEK